jgi:hypothetical protein
MCAADEGIKVLGRQGMSVYVEGVSKSGPKGFANDPRELGLSYPVCLAGGAGQDHQEEGLGPQAVLRLHQGLLGQVSHM